MAEDGDQQTLYWEATAQDAIPHIVTARAGRRVAPQIPAHRVETGREPGDNYLRAKE